MKVRPMGSGSSGAAAVPEHRAGSIVVDGAVGVGAVRSVVGEPSRVDAGAVGEAATSLLRASMVVDTTVPTASSSESSANRAKPIAMAATATITRAKTPVKRRRRLDRSGSSLPEAAAGSPPAGESAPGSRLEPLPSGGGPG
jgi:hypothetical protein